MTKKSLTREQRVYKELAATGKYFNTGKVLIGLTYQRKPPEMTQSEEFMQGILLGRYRRLVSDRTVVYLTIILVVCASLFVSCRA
ncbi:MAG: hypothetical protein ACO2Z7_06500 [Burkholderiaceae bacterium]